MYVDGGVVVAAETTAASTFVPSVFQVLRHDRAAGRTLLRGTTRVHSNDMLTSFFRFVSKALEQ